MKPWQVVLAGFFGGVAPNVIGGAQQLVLRTPDQQSGYLLADPAFLIGTSVIGLIAGALLFFANESNPLKAMALGASAPALILGWAQGGASHPAGPPSADRVGRAQGYAAVSVQLASWPRVDAVFAQYGPSVLVSLRGLREAGLPRADLVTVPRSASGSGRIVYTLTPNDSVAYVSASTSQIYLQYGSATSNRLTLRPGEHGPIFLRATVTRAGIPPGFMRAFGIRGASNLAIELTRIR